jgi:hypothetical protein
MRDLSPLVSGQVEEIYRPAKIPSRSYGFSVTGAQAWFDAAVPSSFSISSNEVTQWADISGSNNHLGATQGAGSRPDYGGGGARTINGIVCPEWTGGGFWPLYQATIPASDLTSTRYIVAQLDSIVSNNAPLLSCYNEHNLGLHLANQSGNIRLVSQHVGTNLGTTYANHDSVAAPAGPAYVFAERRNTNTITLSVNGVRESDSWAPSGVGSNENGLQIGSCHSYRGLGVLDGLIGEIIIYDAVHTDSQMLAVETYLMDKWGIDP